MRSALGLASKSCAELCALVVAASILLISTLARAEVQPPPEVSLVIAAEPRAADELELVVRELLARLSVVVQVSQVPRIDVHEIASPPPLARPLLARVWIDFKKPGRATLYLLATAQDRLLVRTVDRAPTGDELAREELGHILETSAEGLLSGANVGVPRVEAIPLLEPAEPKPAPPPPPAKAAEVVPWWQVGALYEVSALSSQVRLTHGPMLSVLLRAQASKLIVGLWGTAQYRMPIEIGDSPVGATIGSGALRLLATTDVRLSPALSLRLGIGGGTDLVRVETHANAGYVPESPHLRAFGVGRVSTGLEARVASSVLLWLNAAADVDPTSTTYVVDARAGETLVLRPWAVRPAVAVGAAFP
jgi:hypothetical protein